MSEQKRPKVGLAVIILKERKVLLGKRKNSHDTGTWNFPGGHLKYSETFEDCALREAGEETGMKDIHLIDKLPVAVTNDFFEKDGKHYITLFMRARYVGQEPKRMEPDKCEGWRWYDWNDLPENLMLPIKNLLKQGYNPLI